MRVSTIIALALSAFVTWLIFSNRSSERVLTTAGSAVLLIVFYIFFAASQPPVEDYFPAAAYYHKTDKSLIRGGGWRTFADTELNALRQTEPNRFNNPLDENGLQLYHHLLQREIIEWLAMHYSGSWRMDYRAIALHGNEELTGNPIGTQTKSTELDTEALRKILRDNWFARQLPKNPRLELPPGSSLMVRAPEDRDGSTGEIRLKNRLLTITIQTKQGGWGTGPTGEMLLLKWPPDLIQSQYLVSTRIEFSRWFPGDPNMEAYRQWARQLVGMLKSDFDERLLWQKQMQLHRLAQEIDAMKSQNK